LWVHRRGGKGWFGHHEGLAAYVQRLSEPPPSMKVPKFHAWTVVPTFPQARQAETELERFIPDWAKPEPTWNDTSRGYNRADHTFKLVYPNGHGFWEVKSAHDPEGLQTVGLDYLHVQECQDITEAAFNKLLPTLRDPDRLGLSVWEGIPPDDPSHWFARMMTAAEADKNGNSLAVKVNYEDNKDLAPDVRVLIEEDMGVMLERDWRRMYMVELPEGTGSFLGNVAGCIGGQEVNGPEEGHRYVMGVDLAKKVDFTVLVVMDMANRQVVWQRRFGGMDWNVQEEAIITASADFHVRRIMLDSTGVGDPMYDKLLFKGLPVEPFLFTNESKYRLLTELAVAIEKRTVRYPNIPVMLREMQSLRAEKLPSGRSRVEAPDGQHDDYPMALALALSVCDPPPEMMIVGRLGSRSYIEEAGQPARYGGGAWLARQRMLDKIRARQDALEVA